MPSLSDERRTHHSVWTVYLFLSPLSARRSSQSNASISALLRYPVSGIPRISG
jgi:hypothetical protein